MSTSREISDATPPMTTKASLPLPSSIQFIPKSCDFNPIQTWNDVVHRWSSCLRALAHLEDDLLTLETARWLVNLKPKGKNADLRTTSSFAIK
jgi:hypothetical protein